MSSWKNSGNARAHKERAQPASRQRHGLLEKHKDYVLRARDYHKKEKRLRALKEKAFFKNPDEFYFKMTSSKTENGVHKNKTKGIEAKKMKQLTKQDISYISMRRQMEDKVWRVQKVFSGDVY
jgi:U3 small nucleolar RNA-associated protein 11